MDSKIKFKKFIIPLILFSSLASANITGTAFKDFNADGIKQAGEPGVSSITVKAYRDEGSAKESVVAETTTDSNGTYSLDTKGVYPVRVEFELPDNGCGVKKGQDFPSAGGANYGTSIQFANADGEKHNFAISYPMDISMQENPYTFVPVMVSGNPLGSGSTASRLALVKFHFKDEGHAKNSGRGKDDGPAWIELAKQNQIGTTYGMAYSRKANKIFLGALIKRHSGLGPLGTGGIYMIDPNKDSSNQNEINFINLDELGIETSDQSGAYSDALTSNDHVNFSPVVGSNQDRGLPDDVNKPCNDSASYGQVGRLSLGDIEISDDDRYLYVANLYKKNILRIDLTDPKNPIKPTAEKIKEYTPLNPCIEDGVNYGEMIPFALKIYKNKLFVGITCTGADKNGNAVVDDNSGVKGYVYSLDLNDEKTWTKIVSWSFDYRVGDEEEARPWHIWTNTFQKGKFYSIPLVSDIEFDKMGNLLVGVMDVHGNQRGYNNYGLTGTDRSRYEIGGDLLRFVKNPSDCSYKVDLPQDYFEDDNVENESTGGALAVLHSSDRDYTLSTFMDPYMPNGGKNVSWYGNGVVLYDSSNGKAFDVDGNGKYGYEIAYNSLTYVGKANALGDIETMEFVPPIEVGNLVWEDKDQDGIQDAGEPGVKGVKLFLSQGTDCSNKIAETTTDENGNYMFNYANVNPDSNNSGLQANTDYTICVDKSQFENGKGIEGTALEGMYLTSKDKSGKSDNPDKTDSDAKIDADGYVSATIHTKGPGQNDHSIDFGFIKTVCLGDRIWRDDNNNGIQDDNEVNVDEAVKVELLDENGKPVTKDYKGDSANYSTTVTDGKYEFCDLKPGKYQVKFTYPDGYEVSPKKEGNDDKKDSDVNPSTNTTDVVDVQKYKKDLDLGLFKPACIGNRVWLDKNGNGVQDDGENGVAHVTVELYDKDNNLVKSTKTNGMGDYEICELKPDDYYLKIKLPDDSYILSPKNAGGDKEKDSDFDPATLKTEVTTLEPGEKDWTWDAGIYQPPCLGDYTWLDKNVNGLQDANEPALSDVTVTLLDKDGNVVTKAADGSAYQNNPRKTDSSGKYHFCNLKPGTYKVKFTKVHDANGAPYLSTTNEGGDDAKDSDVEKFKDAKDGLVSTPVTIMSGDDNRTVDAGFIQEICLGDKVWEDMNANGVQDNREPALANVPVELMMDNGNGWEAAKDVKGNPIDANQTDAEGNYKFCHLKPAIDYKIVFTKPAGYYVTDKDKGGDDAKDSDINEKSEIIVKNAVKDDMGLDAGYFKPACIGDFVWEDKNGNGIQDDGEQGLDGVTVELLQNGSNVIKDVDGNPIAPLTTSNGGKYHFACKIKPGNYSLKFTTPKGYYFTKKGVNSATDSKDSDVEQFAKEVGTTEPTQLISGEDDRSWDAGVFKPACIGDRIWDDLNGNGIQDKDEVAPKDDNNNTVPVKVELETVASGYDKDLDGKPLNTTIADSGEYKFCKLVPGTYKVKVTVPANWYATRKDKGNNDAKDSDMGEFLDTNKVVEMPSEALSSGENNMTFDGGMFKPSCLGSTVWEDKNANGIKDDDEPGIPDVNVTLLPYKDDYGYENNMTVDKQPFKTIQTDEEGSYQFCGLIPGKYRVMFEAPANEDGTPRFTTGQNRGNDDKDSDAEEYKDGKVITEPVTVNSRTNNQTVFAGYVNEICLGDFVWYDKNLDGVQDANEPGVKGVKVHLSYADGSTVTDVYGNKVSVTKTNAKGKYSFCHLKPGQDYKIRFEVPKSYHPTLQNKGSDNKDSDANENGIIIVKKAAKDDYSNDLGIYCNCDDYKVHPENHKKLKAPALSIYGGILAMMTLLALVLTRREEA